MANTAFSNLIDAVIAATEWEDIDEIEADTEDASDRGYITDEEHDQLMALCYKIRALNDWFPEGYFDDEEDAE